MCGVIDRVVGIKSFAVINELRDRRCGHPSYMAIIFNVVTSSFSICTARKMPDMPPSSRTRMA
jgi:hypothetical protein